MPPYVQVFNRVNKTTVAPNGSPSNEITEPILHDSVPQDSASKPVAIETNPNKIDGGVEKPNSAAQKSNVPYVNKKPKDSRQISEEPNAL